MLQLNIKSTIIQKLTSLFQASDDGIKFSPVGGGCINQNYKVSFGDKSYFCKINSATKFPQLLKKEKNSLDFISRHNIIKTPKPLHYSEANGLQILLLEWIHEGERTNEFWKKFGEQLAALHKISNEFFGRDEDNFMGNVPQTNRQTTSWVEFFIHQRLQPLLLKCIDKKLLSSSHLSLFEKLYQRLPLFFETSEKPSLLHGDLWSGNFMCNKNSDPVLIDPVVYFGHHSVDLGMTTLFGGFPSPFYESYNYHFPFSSNYKEQWEISNLYPLLIHLYLFGKSSLPQIEQTLKRFT